MSDSEKPRLNRGRIRREEVKARSVTTAVSQILSEVHEGESLGEPIRLDGQVVIPIISPEKDNSANDSEADDALQEAGS
jgi:hypothetical protein